MLMSSVCRVMFHHSVTAAVWNWKPAERFHIVCIYKWVCWLQATCTSRWVCSSPPDPLGLSRIWVWRFSWDQIVSILRSDWFIHHPPPPHPNLPFGLLIGQHELFLFSLTLNDHKGGNPSQMDVLKRPIHPPTVASADKTWCRWSHLLNPHCLQIFYRCCISPLLVVLWFSCICRFGLFIKDEARPVFITCSSNSTTSGHAQTEASTTTTLLLQHQY